MGQVACDWKTVCELTYHALPSKAVISVQLSELYCLSFPADGMIRKVSGYPKSLGAAPRREQAALDQRDVYPKNAR